MRLAVAAGTMQAAESAHAIVDRGGNAVDAAVAATFVTWVCEPGLTSMGSGGYCTIWPPGEQPVTIDGFVEMPGRGLPPDRFGQVDEILMDYGGGTRTAVGPGSIGTPGALAAVERAWRRWGSRPWAELLQPAIDLAETGFPLPDVSCRYFRSSGEPIFSRTPEARSFFERDDGTRRQAGERIAMPNLGETLRAIARDGADAFYRGPIGERIGEWIRAHGGLLGADDLAAYEPIERPCLVTDDGRWHLATNPAPAVGGVVLTEIAALMGRRPESAWTAREVAHFVRVMAAAFTDRRSLLAAPDVEAAAATLLGPDLARRRAGLCSSASTSHTSAVDAAGLACSITTSTGYASGIIVPGTGVLLNNVLGEIELNPGGLHAARPGTRLRSNMAPSVVRRDAGDVVAFGAAGADRIVSALAQVWLNVANLGMALGDAVAHPRCHFEWRDGTPTLAHEPGIDLGAVELPTYAFDDLHMFFGGVQAAERTSDGLMVAVADPRRAGGAVVG